MLKLNSYNTNSSIGQMAVITAQLHGQAALKPSTPRENHYKPSADIAYHVEREKEAEGKEAA